MKHILTPISIDELPSGWQKDFPFAALSVKPYKAAAACALLPAGVELHLWEWASFKTPEQARDWGAKMGLACAKYGATRFYIDAEAEWSGEENFAPTKEPYRNLAEAVAAFYLACPEGCELAYNGFTWSRTKDNRKLHDRDLIKTFHAWVPMIYGALEDEKFGFVAKLDKYNIEGQLKIPMLYAGRYDKDGKFIGQDWKVQKKLLLAYKPVECAWYFGNGSKSRWAELVGMVKEIGAAMPVDVPKRPEQYTVRPGDSWWGIADKIYGKGSLWRKLKEANDNTTLDPDDIILLPELV